MDGKQKESPRRRPGAGVCSGERTRGTLSASWSKVKSLYLRFDTLPPRHTRQGQTRLCVVNGKARSFKSATVRQEEANAVAQIVAKLPENWVPFDGPVSVTCHLCYPFRKSEKRRVVRAGREIPHTSRIDLSNLWKGLEDCIVTAQLIRDDSLAAELHLSKSWGPAGYWTIDVVELGEEAPRPFDREAEAPDHRGDQLRPVAQMQLFAEGGE